MTIIGIDPGLSGAVACLDDKGQFVNVLDMPIMQKGKGTGKIKNCVNAGVLAQIICKFWPDLAVLETVNAMPGQGVSSMFSLGDSYGCARSAVAIQGISLIDVSPITWKKYFKINSDKEAARSLAIKLYPTAAPFLTRKKDADRAEAILMARWGYLNHGK